MHLSREDLIILCASTIYAGSEIGLQKAVSKALQIEQEVIKQRKVQDDKPILEDAKEYLKRMRREAEQGPTYNQNCCNGPQNAR